jgi:hypothetical protein
MVVGIAVGDGVGVIIIIITGGGATVTSVVP